MKLMLIQPADLGHDGEPIYAKSAWFDDLTLAHLAALTPRDVACTAVLEKFDRVDFDADVDLVAITSMGVSPMRRAYQIAERFRARGVPVVLGGANFSLQPVEAKEHADAVVVGEAEDVWPRVLEDARRGELDPYYFARPADLAKLPTPRYDLWHGRRELRGALYTVQASRGCPNHCDFCAVGTLHAGKIRFRPIDDVIRDVVASDSKRIFFADDNLMADKSYYMELFRRLIPLKLHWVGAATSSIGQHKDVLALARRSGAVLLVVGVESINQANLNAISKRFNRVDLFEKQIRAIHDAGIIAACTTIFGFDEDDTSVFDATVEFYQRNRVRVAPFFLLTPVPGTVLFTRLKKEQRILTDDHTRYDTVTAVYRPKKMTPAELEAGVRHAYRRMYGLGSIARRLLPPLGNPVADLVAAGMNLQYNRLNRSGDFGVFNFG